MSTSILVLYCIDTEMNLWLVRFGFHGVMLKEFGEAFLRMGRRDPKTRRGKVRN